MDDDSKVQSFVKWSLGALGLGGVATVVAIPKLGIMCLWIALIIIVLALLLFGGYFWWQRRQARRRREQFTSAIESQTAAAPKAISDPNKRAALDKVRQKFQNGLQEFRSRGKDIYKLPWYAIIGESGSGKTEAIRNSGIDFPPGMQDELQGSGGTVNMDWWFTNRGIILDTAGSMIFSESKAGEAPEWREFLRLLKKVRTHCPINGLFLVLSADSLIRDSAEKIAQKASVLAQQLDLIQRTLDVRFPVYLFVTKCDLLTGFREFFDSIDDPLLQHQMFGWSNPDPLDSAFRPDLVEQHLKGIASKIRRRRLGLLREASSAPQYGDTQRFSRSWSSQGGRRIDEVDALFALPESVMRLAPRLRRYLETVFVAGEWSSKPVFLRGIYFTSSMREGKALDEAIAFATGLQLDQLPEERKWEKNRAFFLRDLFHEKVFRESGLVTRATNTLKLLRQRQLAIFGTAGFALLLLTIFAIVAYKNFQNSVGKEARYWQLGAAGFEHGDWAWPIVKAGQTPNVFHFSYEGTNPIEGLDNLTLVDYQARLKNTASRPLSSGLIFKPLVWMGFGKVNDRGEAQRLLFESAVLKPLIDQTRQKMMGNDNSAGNFEYQRQALQALIKLEADNLSARTRYGLLATTNADQVASNYLGSFASYLMDASCPIDTNLSAVMAWTYSKPGGGKWPPTEFLSGGHLSNNPAIKLGLESFRAAKRTVDDRIDVEVQNLNNLTSALEDYAQQESKLLAQPDCSVVAGQLYSAKQLVEVRRQALLSTNNFAATTVTNIGMSYQDLEQAAESASAAEFRDIEAGLPDEYKTSGIIYEIFDQVKKFSSAAAKSVRDNYQKRQNEVNDLDANCLRPVNGLQAYDLRWSLYTGACKLAASSAVVDDKLIGDNWAKYKGLRAGVDQFQATLATYKDPAPFASAVTAACNRIAADAEKSLKEKFAVDYAAVVRTKLSALANQPTWTMATITNTGNWFSLIKSDLDTSPDEQRDLMAPIGKQLRDSSGAVLDGINVQLKGRTGFPVSLNSQTSMNLAGLQNVKELVNGLSAEMDKPVWASDKAKTLQARCRNCVSVVNSLLDDQGNPVSWEIYFVPQGSDRDIIADFRDMKVTFSGIPADWMGVATKDNLVKLGKGTADNALTFSFSQDQGQSVAQNQSEADWGLVRLIRDFNGTPVNNDGTAWRFQLPLVDKGQNIHGNAVFEARLTGAKQPLPKLEDWPRQ